MHVNNACGHTFADAVTGAPPETHSSEGGGVWAEYLPKAALTSNDLFLDDANVLVPVWLGGRGDRPAFPIGRNRIFIYVPSHRVAIANQPLNHPGWVVLCVSVRDCALWSSAGGSPLVPRVIYSLYAVCTDIIANTFIINR